MRERERGKRLEGEERGSLQGRKNKAGQMPGQWELASPAERGESQSSRSPQARPDGAPCHQSWGSHDHTGRGALHSLPKDTLPPGTGGLRAPGPLFPGPCSPHHLPTGSRKTYLPGCGLGRRAEPRPMRFGPLPASMHLTPSGILPPSLHLSLPTCGRSRLAHPALRVSQQPRWAPEAMDGWQRGLCSPHRPLTPFIHLLLRSLSFSHCLFLPSPLLPPLPSFPHPFLSYSLSTLCANPGLGTDASRMDPTGSLGLGSSAQDGAQVLGLVKTDQPPDTDVPAPGQLVPAHVTQPSPRVCVTHFGQFTSGHGAQEAQRLTPAESHVSLLE